MPRNAMGKVNKKDKGKGGAKVKHGGMVEREEREVGTPRKEDGGEGGELRKDVRAKDDAKKAVKVKQRCEALHSRASSLLRGQEQGDWTWARGTNIMNALNNVLTEMDDQVQSDDRAWMANEWKILKKTYDTATLQKMASRFCVVFTPLLDKVEAEIEMLVCMQNGRASALAKQGRPK